MTRLETIAKRTDEQANFAFQHNEFARHRYAAGYSEGAGWAWERAEAETVAAIVGAAREYIAEARDHRYYSPTAHWDRVLSMVDWIEHGGWKKP